MYHTFHLRIFAIDAQMHFQFAGRLCAAAQDISVQIDLDKNILRHISLGNAGRRRPQLVVTDLAADISVVGRHKIFVVHPSANLQNQLLGLIIAHIFAHISHFD